MSSSALFAKDQAPRNSTASAEWRRKAQEFEEILRAVFGRLASTDLAITEIHHKQNHSIVYRGGFVFKLYGDNFLDEFESERRALEGAAGEGVVEYLGNSSVPSDGDVKKIATTIVLRELCEVRQLGLAQEREGWRGQPTPRFHWIATRRYNKNLSELLESESAMDRQRAIDIFKQICKSVGRLHSLGIIHGDIKPSNILVGLDGRPDVIALADFGLSSLGEKPAQGQPVRAKAKRYGGSAGFMCPNMMNRMLQKQAEREKPGASGDDGVDITSHADIYGLGAVFSLLLGGRLVSVPVQGAAKAQATGSHHGLIASTHQRPVALPENLPEQLAAICNKAMSPELANRYRTVEEILGDLDGFAKLPTSVQSPADAQEVKVGREESASPVALPASARRVSKSALMQPNWLRLGLQLACIAASFYAGFTVWERLLADRHVGRDMRPPSEESRTERDGAEWLKAQTPSMVFHNPVCWQGAALYVRPPDDEGRYGLELIDTDSRISLEAVRPNWTGIQRPEQLMVTSGGSSIFVAGIGDGGEGRLIARYEGVRSLSESGGGMQLGLEFQESEPLPRGSGQIYAIALWEAGSRVFVQVESPRDEPAALVYSIHWPPAPGEQWTVGRFLHCGYLLRCFDEWTSALVFWNYSDRGKTIARIPFDSK